jgi:hypothetical protein
MLLITLAPLGQNRCAVLPRGNIGATPSSCILRKSDCDIMEGCSLGRPYCKGASHDCSTTTNDGGMQVRNLSPHTQASYLQQVSLFARHFDKSPDVLNSEHIRTYQIYMTNERKLATGSIHIAVAALRFLYKIPRAGMDLCGCASSSQEAAQTARRSEPGGSRTFPRMRCLSKTARNPDRLLRCRLACIGSCSAECRRNR